MNNLKSSLSAMLCCLGGLIMLSCGKGLSVPPQPDFIIVGLEEPFSIMMGETFELSIPAEDAADIYRWSLPASLNLLEGEETNKITVAGLEETLIPSGSISVTAVNGAGESVPRTLWRDIAITGLPPQPDYIQISVKGSLTVDKDEIFTFNAEENESVASYSWSVPQTLEIVSGQGTREIQVRARTGSVLIPPGSVQLSIITKTGLSQAYNFGWRLCVLPIDNYHTAKRYGDKTWMTVNLNYAGADGNVGKTAPDDPDGNLYGRYYTWTEAMTGSSTAENPYLYGTTGVDDMGASYTLNNSPASHGIQVRGICPEGWHVPNAYDFYDLIAGVARDYGLEKKSIQEVSDTKEGIFLPDNREKSPMSPGNLISYGFISSYLRGSRPAAEGGMWNAHSLAVENGTMFNLANASGAFPAGYYPMYFPEMNEIIGFNILPCGKYTGENFGSFGTYSFHWTATVTDANRNYRFTVGNNSCNLSTYAETGSSNNLRCVADYPTR